MIDHASLQGEQHVLVGSSIGAWIALKAAASRREVIKVAASPPQRVMPITQSWRSCTVVFGTFAFLGFPLLNQDMGENPFPPFHSPLRLRLPALNFAGPIDLTFATIYQSRLG